MQMEQYHEGITYPKKQQTVSLNRCVKVTSDSILLLFVSEYGMVLFFNWLNLITPY